jgi:hypothetical protein
MSARSPYMAVVLGLALLAVFRRATLSNPTLNKN